MNSGGGLKLPPLRTDGRVDVLTGLDAPEIFYKFLEKAIASHERASANRRASDVDFALPDLVAEAATDYLVTPSSRDAEPRDAEPRDAEPRDAETPLATPATQRSQSSLGLVMLRLDAQGLMSAREAASSHRASVPSQPSKTGQLDHLDQSVQLDHLDQPSQPSSKPSEDVRNFSNEEGDLAFVEITLASIAGFLKRRTRSEEILVRIGEVTFLILAKFSHHDEALQMIARLQAALSDLILFGEPGRSTVDRDQSVINSADSHSAAEFLTIQVFTYVDGEGMLNFLERAGV